MAWHAFKQFEIDSKLLEVNLCTDLSILVPLCLLRYDRILFCFETQWLTISAFKDRSLTSLALAFWTSTLLSTTAHSRSLHVSIRRFSTSLKANARQSLSERSSETLWVWLTLLSHRDEAAVVSELLNEADDGTGSCVTATSKLIFLAACTSEVRNWSFQESDGVKALG